MGTQTATEQVDSSDQGGLKRVIGPRLLLFFIVGDIIGAGVFAITGDVAGEVGGIAWVPFLVAFSVAALTALSYLELVTKHPQAAGAALFVHKAFGVHFLTFIVAFAVVCSGITSASTSSGLVASNLLLGLDGLVGGVPTGDTATLLVALGFMVLLALVNLRGVGESVKFNVVLTSVVVLALGVIIAIGFWAMASDGDVGRIVVFESSGDKNVFVAITIATTVAFFAMVGFEDSVNMVEEVEDPGRTFPRVMLTGLGICAVIYVLVAITVVVVIPPGRHRRPGQPRGRHPARRRARRRPGPAHRRHLPVPHRLRGRQHGPDQHADGQPAHLRDGQAGRAAALAVRRASRAPLAVGRDRVHHADGAGPDHLRAPALRQRHRGGPGRHHRPAAPGGLHGGQHRLPGAAPRHPHRAGLPGSRRWVPYAGAVTAAFLVGPWARNEDDYIQYSIAGYLLLIGVALWLLSWLTNRGVRAKKTGFRDIDHLEEQ